MGKAEKNAKKRKMNRQRMKQKLAPLPTAAPPKKQEEMEEEEEDEESSDDELDSDPETALGKKSDGVEEESDSDDDDDDGDDADDSLGGGTLKISKHKRDMEKLKESDPEFFKYLESADKELLDFEASDDEVEDLEDEDEDEDEKEEGMDEDDKIHKPPEKLEVVSDESDAEEQPSKEEAEKTKKARGGVKVTQKMVSLWSRKIREESSLGSLKKLIGAFRCAVQQCGAKKEEEKVKQSAYIVEGSAVFNAVVRACLLEIRPALHVILKLPSEKTMEKKDMIPSESSFWMRVQKDVRLYLIGLMQLLQEMAESSIVGVVLKHIHQMVPYVICFPKIARAATRRLVKLWSQEEETVRVLAFLSILKIVHRLQDKLLDIVIKSMYVAFVRNTKFTSPSTLPLINFMQHSLVELLLLNPVVAYQQAFVYIRQLAIHLRNAVTVHKKETVQTVYNWQFIHSLHLWCRMLAAAGPSNATLKPLIYPLTQVAFGVMKLNPSVKFLPLRFHCIRALNILGEATNTYIPLLSPTIDVFSLVNFTKPFPSTSVKPLNFACMLKLSKKQLKERSLQDGAIDQIYDMIVEHCGALSHSISFPELVIPAVVRMKKFLKTTSASRFIKLVKQMLTLIQENSTFIENKRKSVSFGISDLAAVERWENELKQSGTPLSKYLETYKVKRIEELRLADASRDQQEKEKRGEETKKRQGEEKKGQTGKKRKRGDDDEEDEEEEDDEDMVDLTEEDFAKAGSDSEEEGDDDDDDDEEEEEDEDGDFDEEEFKGDLQKKKLSKAELKKLKAKKDVVEDFDLGESDEEDVGNDGDDDEDDDDNDDDEEEED